MANYRQRIRFFYSLFAVCAFLWPAGAQLTTNKRIKSNREELKHIRDAISQKKRERRKTDQKAQELEQEVERISLELRAARRSLKEVQSRLEEVEGRRKTVEARVWVSRLGIDQRGDLLSQEMGRYYVRRVAAEAGRSVELFYRRAMMEDTIFELKSALRRHAVVEDERDDLVGLERQFQRLREQKEKDEERVEAAQTQMRGLYQTIQGRRALLEKEILDLRAEAKGFEALIRKLIGEQQAQEDAQARLSEASRRTKASQQKSEFSGLSAVSQSKKGRLPWPMEGAVVERYGKSKHPTLETYIFSNGIKLRPGQPGLVRAVEKGEVVYVGDFMSYGRMALLSHPGNFHSIYAQMGRLNVVRGQKVSVGEALGTAGQDNEGHPLVYFEWRVSGIAVDPLLWLR